MSYVYSCSQLGYNIIYIYRHTAGLITQTVYYVYMYKHQDYSLGSCFRKLRNAIVGPLELLDDGPLWPPPATKHLQGAARVARPPPDQLRVSHGEGSGGVLLAGREGRELEGSFSKRLSGFRERCSSGRS